MASKWRRAISLGLTFVMLCSLIVLPAQAAGTKSISLSLEETTPYEGYMTYNVVAKTSDSSNFDIIEAQGTITFDKTVLSYVGILDGNVPPAKAGLVNSEMTTSATDPSSADGSAEFTLTDGKNVNHTAPSGVVLAKVCFQPASGVETCDTNLTLNVSKVGYKDAESNSIQHTLQNPASPLSVHVTGALPKFNETTVTLASGEVTVDGQSEKTAQITVKSLKDTNITNSVSYTVTPADQGVTVDGTGKITATAKAKAGDYTIAISGIAGKSEGSAQKTFKVNRAAAEVQSVAIYQGATKLGASATIIIPTSGTKTYAYTAKITDQYGDETLATAPTWSFVTEDDKVTFANGTVTVATGAAKGTTYTLTATVGSKSASVTLTAQDINITWPNVTINDATYGRTWQQIVSLSGGSASLEGAAVPGTFTVESAGTSTIPAAGSQNYIIRFKSADGQYDVTDTRTQEIAKKTLTVLPGDFSVTKEYDGNVAVPDGEGVIISGALALSGIVGQDKVALAAPVRANMAYDNATIGNSHVLTITGLTLTGDAAANYTVAETYQFRGAKIVKTLPKLEHFDVTIPENFEYDGTKTGTAKVEVKSGVTGMGAVTVLYAKQNATGWDAATSTAPVNAGTYKVLARIAEGSGYSAVDALDTTRTFTITPATRTLTVSPATLTLTPKALTGEVTLTYPDADKSGQENFVMTGSVAAVSRTGRTFTAQGNGTVTVTVSVTNKAGSANNYYDGAPQTITVNAIKEPVTGITSVTGASGDQLAGALNGKTVVVSGFVTAEGTVPTVTPTLAEGFGLTAEQDGKTLNIKDSEGNVIDTLTIDTSNVVVKPANVEIDDAATGTAAGAAVENAAESAARAAINAATEVAKDADGAIAAALGTDSFIVRATVSVQVDDMTHYGAAPGTYRISASYNFTAEGNSKTHDAGSKPAASGDFKTPFSVSVTVAAGKTYQYAKFGNQYLPVTMSGTTATWNQPGLGTVELVEAAGTVTITYTKSDGSVVSVVHDISKLTLETDRGSGTFKGWKFYDGDTEITDIPARGPLTAELLAKYNGKTITAVSQGFSYSGGGGGSSGGGSYIPSGANNVTVKRTSNGSVSASPSYAKKGETVTLTVRPNTGYVLDSITVTDKDGNTIRLREQETNVYTFTMPGSAVTVEATFKAAEGASKNPFSDVSSSAYYYDAVIWAVENGITGGTTPTTFAPGSACTRAQTVTFLWRAAGQPRPRSSVNPFTDVAPGSYYYDAVLWAVEQGITNGLTATTFGPNATVNRGQVVTFLFRSAKASPVDEANPFSDVSESAYYSDAVLWAVANGITNGNTATTFGPTAPCTRGQIVTFLYRHFV